MARRTPRWGVALLLAHCSLSCGGGGGGSGSDEELELLDRLLATHSRGVGGPLTASSDGSRLLVAEGGSLAIVDPSSSQGMAEPLALRTMGREAILPVSLELDPRSSPPYRAEDPFDLLYVAAGRSGLWCIVLDEEGDAGSYEAVRLDDAGDDAFAQASTRWCAALCQFEMEGEEHLAALFSEKDDTRLRVYALASLHGAVAAAASETGGEVSALVEVRFPRHPEQHDAQARSFGFGLAADRVAADEVMLYAALGAGGVARVRLRPGDLAGQGTPDLEFGPVFGDGSWYAQAEGELYGHFPFRATAGGAIERAIAPQALDVAVEARPGAHHLYVALDHLGWLRFDLEGLSPFGSNMRIDHHEGAPFRDAHGGWHARLLPRDVDQGSRIFTHVRRLRILTTVTGTYLAVAADTAPFTARPDVRADGSVLSSDFLRICGVSQDALEPIVGEHAHTLLYRLPDGPFADDQNLSYVHHAGGEEVWIAEGQSGARLLVFGGNESRPPFPDDEVLLGISNAPNTTFALTLDAASLHEEDLVVRATDDRPGRFNHVVGCFEQRPEVLILGVNDGAVVDDGITTLCEQGFEIDYDELAAGGDDERGSFGIFFDPRAQWPAASGSSTWVWGTGVPAIGGGPARWCVTLFHPGTTSCPTGAADPPALLARSWLEPPLDRFGYRGRQYWCATLDREYDGENDGPAWPLVFATRGGSPDGLFVLRRDRVEEVLATHGGQEIDLADDLGSALVTVLDTHPEFANVDASHPDAEHFLERLHLNGVVQTFAPHLFRAPGPGSATSDTWVLAVPCGMLALDPELTVFDEHPSWRPPSRFAQSLDHLLVRMWNVQDPSAATLAAQVPVEIVGPDARAMAIDVEAVQWLGRVLLFVADHGGRILVHDATSVLQPGGSAALLDRWVAPGGVHDDLANTLRTIALDRRVWTDQHGQPREELHVYVGVQRRGVEVLRWNDALERLEPVGRIETPSNAHWITLCDRDLGGGVVERALLVADGIGLRAYARGN